PASRHPERNRASSSPSWSGTCQWPPVLPSVILSVIANSTPETTKVMWMRASDPGRLEPLGEARAPGALDRGRAARRLRAQRRHVDAGRRRDLGAVADEPALERAARG